MAQKLINGWAAFHRLARKAKRYELVRPPFVDPQSELSDWPFPVPSGAHDVLNVLLGNIHHFGTFSCVSFDLILDAMIEFLLSRHASSESLGITISETSSEPR